MAQVIVSCELADLSVAANGTVLCLSDWQFKEVMFPLYELSGEDLALTMAATATFLITCYAGRRVVKFIDKLGTTETQ